MTQALLNIGDFVGFVPQSPMQVPTPKAWYMLKLHPNYDLKAERQLTERGVSTYLPKEQMAKKIGWGKYDRRWVPLFPGSIFIPDFEADLPRLKMIADGIGGFVRSGSEPLRITLTWMERIKAFEQKMLAQPVKRKFTIGQEVRIINGPWEMWEGKIIRLDPNHRIRMLIEAMQGEVPIELDEDQVEAV
jgi:transcription antitermination factor NusG